MNEEDNIKKFSDALRSLLQSEGLDQKIKRASVIRLWPEVVGPHIAKHTFNLHFDKNKNILIVQVTSDALRQELQYMKPQIIQSIHQYIQVEFLEDIIFY